MVYVRWLIWDAWNMAHIALHGVAPEEVEEACHGEHITDETYKGRIRLIGTTAAGRMLTVILAPQEEQGVYYVITARDAGRKERRRYRERRGGEES